eukprot:TRINITY_DN98327_c0_g1_i1.p1 TRINITY_DN98327_c0_g1~~TRINITY_DN98327_c0_g1_i1.p1  ORF type:complete len:202 (-),score=26.26 TRINITY_DN98327_c0_g1_i1:32-577(-)
MVRLWLKRRRGTLLLSLLLLLAVETTSPRLRAFLPPHRQAWLAELSRAGAAAALGAVVAPEASWAGGGLSLGTGSPQATPFSLTPSRNDLPEILADEANPSPITNPATLDLGEYQGDGFFQGLAVFGTLFFLSTVALTVEDLTGEGLEKQGPKFGDDYFKEGFDPYGGKGKKGKKGKAAKK